MTRAEKAELIKKYTEETNAIQPKAEAPKTPAVKTFEVDGEQIRYEAEKCNDTQISNAWLAIVKANR